MSKKNTAETVTTCIVLTSDNMKLLDKWRAETGLSKGRILDLLIENAANTGVQLQVTYDLKK